MDKFWKLSDTFVWHKHNSCIFVAKNNIGANSSCNLEGWEPSTREEFIAAAMQAIEKLKAQGIDIGTEWLPKWDLKPGEIVWCWDDSDKRFINFGKYQGGGNTQYPYLVSGCTWQHIAPFTGEIPEPFKSRWEAEGNG